MTAASAPVAVRPARGSAVPGRGAWRLLRLELRRNAMLWMLPLAVALFWYNAYRGAMALPPLWNLRAMTMQNGALLDFVPPVVGAAAWMGSREGRRGMTDLVTGTARPRWSARLATWAATTCWALVAYLGCVGFFYLMTARQAASSGPLWWPAAVGAVGIPALSAIGFAAGALRPGRFTAPLVTVAVFVALGFGAEAARGSASYWQIAPITSGPANLGPSSGVATFYHYLPDLSIAQLMFLAGVIAAVLGGLGLPASSGGRWLRRSAAITAAAGLLAAGTAVALVGTARLNAHGTITIPALHDAASDRPIRYTPVCGPTSIPVCLQPAYTAYLPVVTAALEPVLREVAGLSGAPVRVSQVAPVFRQVQTNGISVSMTGPAIAGTPPVFRLLLPDQLPGESADSARVTDAELAAWVRSGAAVPIVDATVYGGGDEPAAGLPRGQALAAVAAGLLQAAGISRSGPLTPGAPRPAQGPEPAPGSAAAAAAQRFAHLPATARHAWLAAHLAQLRAGRITVAQLP
jgi:hypothetical protein